MQRLRARSGSVTVAKIAQPPSASAVAMRGHPDGVRLHAVVGEAALRERRAASRCCAPRGGSARDDPARAPAMR
jgi:hypothetical protein